MNQKFVAGSLYKIEAYPGPSKVCTVNRSAKPKQSQNHFRCSNVNLFIVLLVFNIVNF